MKAHRAAVLAEVATNEAALLPEQVLILQRCVGASTHKSMMALQQELRGEDVAAQRALAVALRRRIAAVRTEGLCLQLLEMSLGDQDVATAEQFKRLFTPVAAVVRATQQPVVEEAVAANTMHTVVEEVVAAAGADADWMEEQEQPDVVQDEDPLEEQDALLEEQDYLLALLNRWMVVEDCAHQPMEVEDEELAQAQAQDEHVRRRQQAEQRLEMEEAAAEQQDPIPMEAAAHVSPRRNPHKRPNHPEYLGPSPATTAAARRRRVSGDCEQRAMLEAAFASCDDDDGGALRAAHQEALVRAAVVRRRAQEEEQQWEEECRLQAAAAQALAFAEAEAQEAAAAAAADAQVQRATELAFAEAEAAAAVRRDLATFGFGRAAVTAAIVALRLRGEALEVNAVLHEIEKEVSGDCEQRAMLEAAFASCDDDDGGALRAAHQEALVRAAVVRRRAQEEEQQWEEECRLQAAAAQALAFAEAEAQEAAAAAAADAQVQRATELAFAEAEAQDAAKAQREEAVGRLKAAEEWVRVAEAEAAFRKDAAAAAAGFVGDVADVAAKAEKKAAKARRSWLFALLWVKVLTDAPDAAAAALGKHAHHRKADPLTTMALAAVKAFRSANPCGDGGIAKDPISGELTPACQVHITAIFWHYFDLGKGAADLHCDVGAGRGAPQMLAALLLLVRTMGVEVVPLRVWVMQYCVAAGLAKWRELGGGGMAVALRTTFSSHLADVLAGAPLHGVGGHPATHVQCFSTGMPDPVIDALVRILNAMRSVVCVAAYHDLVDHGLRAEEQTALKTTVTMYESGEAKTCRFFKMLSAAEWAAQHPQDEDDDEEDLIVPVPIVLPLVPVPGRFTVTFAEGAPADAPARIVEQVGVPAQGAPGARQR